MVEFVTRFVACRQFEEVQRQLEEAKRQHESELARIRADEEAKANKSGAVPEILVLGSHTPVRQEVNVEFQCRRCTRSSNSLLKAGEKISWWPEGGDAALEGWLNIKLALSDRDALGSGLRP